MRPSSRERSCAVKDFAVSTTIGGPSESRSGRSSSMTAKPSTWGMSRSMTTTDGRDRTHEVGRLLAARARVHLPAERLEGAAHELERERVVVDDDDA